MALQLHFHILYLDGVYVHEEPGRDDSSLVFRSLPTPTRAETSEMARRIADRVDALLKKHGRSLGPDETDPDPTELQLEHPALAACYHAAAMGVAVSGERAGQPNLRLLTTDTEQQAARDALPDEPVAQVRGINLYGRQWVHGRDRKQLERLCRYITRPPIAQDRLTRRLGSQELADRLPPWKAPLRGPCPLRFKQAWKDGSHGLVLDREDLLVRLCAAVPPPRFHMVRYFGVLSSHSSYRATVVPAPPEDTTQRRPPPAPGDQQELFGEPDETADATPRHRWAWLLAHVFAADLETCPKCGGAMRWAEVARTESRALRLMARLGLAANPPPPRQHLPLGQLRLRFDD